MIKLIIGCTVASLVVTSAPLTAQTTIERLAPENSVFVVGSRNAQAAVDHFKATGLWSLWQSEKLKTLRADATKQMTEGIDTMLEELGVEKDSLVCPAGPVGMAVFTIADPELGMPQLAFVALADYGNAANADKTDQLIQAALARGEKDGNIEYEQKDLAGRTLYSIDISELHEEDDQPQPEDMFEDDPGMDMRMLPISDVHAVLEEMEAIHFLRDGNSFIFCSDLIALTEALDTIDGRTPRGAAPRSFAERADYQAIMGKLGENDAFAVVLTRDIMDLISAQDDSGMVEMMLPMARALVGKVDGYGLGVRLDAPSAMVEQRFAVYMPSGKAGLTRLIDSAAPRGALPAFAGSNTVSFSSFNFEFTGVMDLIRTVVNSNAMLQMQMGEQMGAIEDTVGPLTAALGSQVHVVSSATKPLTSSSFHSLIAVECRKPQEFESALAALAGPMDMEPRDFLGQRIYAIDPEMLMMMAPPGMEMDVESLSLGIGGGFVLCGTTPAVEQSLRATSQPAGGGGGLANNPEFQRAVAALPPQNVIGWGFTDTVNSLEATVVQQRLAMQEMIDQARAWDPEGAAQIEAEMKTQLQIVDQIDFNLLRDYIGPSVWQITATADGFEGSAYLLSAEK